MCVCEAKAAASGGLKGCHMKLYIYETTKIYAKNNKRYKINETNIL